eukprot:6519379-Alexandrium_andersonii.AAC.1
MGHVTNPCDARPKKGQNLQRWAKAATSPANIITKQPATPWAIVFSIAPRWATQDASGGIRSAPTGLTQEARAG